MPVGRPGMGGRGPIRSTRVSRAPFHVVCYGNSLTLGWTSPNNYPAALAALRPQDTVNNVGINNYSTDLMLANFATDVVPLWSGTTKTKVCIWWESVVSMNDNGITPSSEYAKLQSAASLVHSHGALFVVSGSIPNKDPTAYTTANPLLTPQLAALLRADHSWADGWSDLPADSRVQDPDNATYFQDAGSSVSVHLTGLGYTDVVAPAFAAVLSGME